ncbi:DUF11 domain-containing protein [Luteolibacter marinus]|uniref:DUF11 domain-containing protein n=1 Tax=Luteolibacter marinus TaxID=2776705 RepID=UPI001865DBBD|nr:DUF11 domain-containing protein [Luteolibacter marinus]
MISAKYFLRTLVAATVGLPVSRPFLLLLAVVLAMSAPARAIYSTEFGGKSLGKGWRVGKVAKGQARISTEFQPYSFDHHLVLDSKQQGVASVAEATLQWPLSNYYGVTLGFAVKSLGNQPDAPPEGIFGKDLRHFDGVSVSNDGKHWISIMSFADVGPTARRYYLSLDEAAARLGGFGKKFRIRFSWCGDGVAGTDGLAIDQVSLEGTWDDRVKVEVPPVVLEGDGPVAVRLTRRLVTKQATVISLSQSPAGVLVMPSTVTFPPGAAEVGFEVSAADDGVLDPHRKTVIHASVSRGIVGSKAVRVGDVTPLELAMELPGSVGEGGATKEGRLLFNRPPDSALTVTLEADSAEIVLPASLDLPFGEMEAAFPVAAADDWEIDGDVVVQVAAAYPGGGATGSLVAVDDDAAELRLTLPESITEGSTVAGSVRLGAASAGPVTVTLDAGPFLSVEPATLVIPGPPYTAEFVVRAADDSVAGPVHHDMVRATAAGYAAAESSLRLLDDEPSSFRIDVLGDMMVPGQPFPVSIQALDADGEPLQTVGGSLPLAMVFSDGSILSGSPSLVTLQDGVWQGEITPPSGAGTPVELVVKHSTGVEVSRTMDAVRTLPWKAADLAYDPGRGVIYAAIPKQQPEYSNTILAIDPASGAVTGSLVLANDPRKLAITGGGEFLYVALQDNGTIAQIDLATWSVVRTFELGRDFFGNLIITRDMCTAAGNPDLLIVTLRAAHTTAAGGARVFERGVGLPEQIEMSSGRTILIEPSDDPNRFFSYDPDSSEFGFEWLELTGNGIRFVERYQGLFANSVIDGSWSIESDIVTDGSLVFHTNGRRVDGHLPRRLQGFPLAGPVRPDLAAGRVYYLVQADSPSDHRFDRLAACDPHSSEVLFQLAFPESHDKPGSFIRWGGTGLAFRSDKGITLFNGSRSLPSVQAVDLRVNIDAPADPVGVGERFSIAVEVANPGPAVAPDSRLNVELMGCEIEEIDAAGIPVEQSGASLVFSPGDLAPGSSRSIVLTVTGSSPALAGCSARVFAASREQTPGDNGDRAMWMIGFDQGAYSFNHLELPVSDLLHDPTRGSIWLGLRGSVGVGLGKAVVPVDPLTGRVGEPIPLNAEPAKLAISENGDYLYVALLDQPEVKRIHLPSQRVDRSIPMGSGPEAARLFAGDMEVIKGDGRTLMVARYDPSIRPDHKGVAVYDDEAMRPNVTQGHIGSNLIESSADPALFFGYDNASTEFGFRHLEVDATGVKEVEVRRYLVGGFGGEIKSAGDKIFGTGGSVVDGRHFQGLGAFGNSGPLVPDAPTGRVYFVDYATTSQTGFDAISVWDSENFTHQFSVSLPHGYTYPRSFIRWGANGLAFRTDSAVAIFSDPQLVPSGPAADLTVSVEATPASVSVGDEIVYRITLENSGPATATDCLVSVGISGAQALESAGGVPHIESDGWVSFLPGKLQPGDSVVMTVAARAEFAGSAICSATAISSAVDTSASGNAAMAVVPVGFETEGDALNRIDLATAGLADDPERGLVWASVPFAGPGAERLIVSLDPESGRIIDKIPLRNMPGELSIAKNGAYLYAELLDRNAIQRIDLAVKSPDLLIPLGSGLYAGDIEVLEGDGRSILVSLKQYNDSVGYGGLVVFDDDVRRPSESGPNQTIASRIVPSSDSEHFYGVNSGTTWAHFSRLRVDESGVSILDSTASLFSNFPIDIWSAGDLVIGNRGEVVDGLVAEGKDHFDATGLVVPAFDLNRVFFLELGTIGGSSPGSRISAHDARIRSKVLDFPLPENLGQADDFIRVGGRQMAFRADGSVYFVRSSQLVPSGPEADLAVTVQAYPVSPTVGEPLSYSIEVTNQGVNPAEDLVIGAILSPHQSVTALHAENGSHEINGQRVRISLEALPAGAAKVLIVEATPLSAGALSAQVGVTSAHVDPDLANNTASVSVTAGLVPATDSARLLRQQANDLIEDSTRGVIWISSSSAAGDGSLLSVDPHTGIVSGPMAVTGNPGTLAISKNGRYLYAALTNRPEIHRYDLDGKVRDLVIPLGEDGPRRQFRAGDMVVLEGDGTSLLVARNDELSWPSSGLVVYDGVEPRSVVVSRDGTGARIEASSDPAVFYLFNPSSYARGLRKVVVDDLGVSLLSGPAAFGGDYLARDIRADGDLVVSSSGRLADGDDMTQLGVFPGLPSPYLSLPWIDASTRRAYFGGSGGIRAFSTETLADLGLGPSISGLGFHDARKLIRWGTDGFAMLGKLATDQFEDPPGGIMLVRWSAEPYPSRAPVTDTSLAAGPWSPDPSSDRDGDGTTDVFEQLFGTSPDQPGQSPLRMDSPLPYEDTLRIRFPRLAGFYTRPYRYGISDDLSRWEAPGSVSERVTGVVERDGVRVELIEAEITKPSRGKGFIRLEWAEPPP